MIIKYPNPILSKKAKPVKKYTEKFAHIINKMIMEMIRNKGVGLAAPQIGKLIRVIVVNNPETDAPFDYILVNPKIINSEGVIHSKEGCLSIPNATVEVTRHKKIMVEAQTQYLDKVFVEAEGILAVIIQHEIDHLNGITLIDYLKGN